MKFGEPKAEAGYHLAVAGKVRTEVGVRSDTGEVGPMWQALVNVGRSNLIRVGSFDIATKLKPGYEYLCWLVEDEEGHLIVHKSVDVDADGHAEKIAALDAEFEAVVQHYALPLDTEYTFGS